MKKLAKDWWQKGGALGIGGLRRARGKDSSVRKLEDFAALKAEKAYESLDDIPNFMSVTELAAKLGVSKSTIRKDIQDGLLPVEVVGRQKRIDPKNVKAYLAVKRDHILKKSA